MSKTETRYLSPSERLLRDVLDASLSDDDAQISGAVIEWTDNENRRWRRAAGEEQPTLLRVL